MRKRTLYWILAALFAASAIYAPFDDNRDSGLPLTIVTIIALVALAVGFAMAARKVDPEARIQEEAEERHEDEVQASQGQRPHGGQLHLHRLGDHRVLAKR